MWNLTMNPRNAESFLPPYHFQWGKWDIVVSIIIIIVIAVWLDILEEWGNLISFLLRLAPAAGGERETFDVHKKTKKCHRDHVTWQHKKEKKKKTGPQKPSGPDSAAPTKSKIGKSDFFLFFRKKKKIFVEIFLLFVVFRETSNFSRQSEGNGCKP